MIESIPKPYHRINLKALVEKGKIIATLGDGKKVESENSIMKLNGKSRLFFYCLDSSQFLFICYFNNILNFNFLLFSVWKLLIFTLWLVRLVRRKNITQP